MTEAPVTNIQKFSVHDGPGIRSTVFLKGCPLSCIWCANPENISGSRQLTFQEGRCIGCGWCRDACPAGAAAAGEGGRTVFDRTRCTLCGRCEQVCPTQACTIQGKIRTAEDLIEELQGDEAFYRRSGGGVTFSGGEPLLHPDLVSDVCGYFRHRQVGTAVETCGAVPWEHFEKVLPVTDLFLFDLKMADPEKHRKYCGQTNTEILENFRCLCERSDQTRIIARLPLIPGINDGEDDLKEAGRFLKELNAGISEIHCLPYHDLGIGKYRTLGMRCEGENIHVPDEAYVKERVDILQMYLERDIRIGG